MFENKITEILKYLFFLIHKYIERIEYNTGYGIYSIVSY